MREVTLDDKYVAETGTVLMNGTQALVRLPLLQREIDRRKGLETSGFISGYRGSPIGNYDLELWRAQAHLAAHDIVFQPGVNEELAATAVWGTQMLGTVPQANRDGVFAIWYGKGPGVDRSCDAFRHGNIAGSHPNGGVLVVAGDDHSGKSSTLAHQSEPALIHAEMPILAPSNVQDMLELGLLGWAMSRYTGLWTGFKLCNEVLEQTMTVDLDALRRTPVLPDRGPAPPNGFHNFPTHLDRQQSDMVVKRHRWPLIGRFVRANRIDRVLIAAPRRRLGIVSAGKAVQDVRQALRLLGLDDAAAAAAGVSVYKVGCVYPLEAEGLAAFAADHEELLFVEEKRGLVEDQARSILYAADPRPRIVGKHDEQGQPMIPADLQLEAAQIAVVIAERLKRMGLGGPQVEAGAAELAGVLAQTRTNGGDVARSPYFCSGCPHNTSTRFPEGSIAAGGIGCHAMAMYSGPAMLPNAQMGGEGAHWYSQAHFSEMSHIFQNMGDGTYYHSGLLAVRGAVAAGVNITFKILFNDAVAMTGGQPVDGPLSVGDISRQVLAEGAKSCVVVTDRPELYGPNSGLGEGVRVRHRDELDAVQRELRAVEGTTVLIYEQTCAAEKRRRRKRGRFPDPAKRMFINPAVCEGCGDCSVQSNCVSVWPLETEWGRKRQIDQSNCNKDYSCVKGFCPSFVTVLDAEPRKPGRAALADMADEGLPAPAIVPLDSEYAIMVSGIGGTGVVTIGALLAMAAHLEGKSASVFDMTGLSQKNGAVFSHVRIAQTADRLGAHKLGAGEADVALAFDAVAALAPEPAVTFRRDRTRAVVNARITPTPAFQRNPDLKIDESLLLGRIAANAHTMHPVDATGIGLALLGDTIAANLFLLGHASQLGLLPVGPDAIIRAIAINAVAVPFNTSAFALGRLQAVDPDRVAAAVAERTTGGEPAVLETLEEIVAHRSQWLTDYQDAAYAAHYRAVVDVVAAAERKAVGGEALSVIVAGNLAKLMAYKDEYEVGRLHSDPASKAALRAAFEHGARLRYNLAPPLLARRDKETGHLRKREFGPWIEPVFTLLARMKRLRGTVFDPFGYTAERRMERALIDEYVERMQMIARELTPDNHAAAIALASLPEQVRGYGHVKLAGVERMRALEPAAIARFRDGGPATPARPHAMSA